MNEPMFLTLDEVLQLHTEALEHFGGQDGIRDITLIESAIATPCQAFGGEFLHTDLAAMAGAYLYHLARQPRIYRRQLTNGSRRLASPPYVFLALNSCRIRFSP